jgi:TPR repeat protein
MYQNDPGVREDSNEAVKWYRKAAEQGDPKGMCLLARHFPYAFLLTTIVSGFRDFISP